VISGEPERRSVIKASLAVPLVWQAAPAWSAVAEGAIFGAESLYSDIKAYAGAGNKRSGGPGDRWTADWMAQRLRDAGFIVERQTFDAPWFEADICELGLGELKIPLVPQPPVSLTDVGGLRAPLRLAEFPGSLDGSIAVVRLPYGRWSSLLDRAVREPIVDVAARGAAAIIVVTNGPTGEALLLNAPADRPFVDRPMALLAPKKAAVVIEAARYAQEASFSLLGNGGLRAAENVIGRRERVGQKKWIVVSTPRSGWTDCAGERGPGIAIWLALAAWAPHAFPHHKLMFVANSGHEYENLGAAHLVRESGPPPSDTDFWLHLGANAATRDWHEIPGRLLPLPSADSHRFLLTSADLVDRARAIFAGQPGIEMAYPSSEGAAGELSAIVNAGYPRHAGVFGAHRQHHAESDDMSTITPAPLAATARGFRDLLSSAISTPR
jgi:hypothetical protein